MRALALTLALLLAGCMLPERAPEGHCQEPNGEFLLVHENGGGFQIYEAYHSGASVIRWDGALLSFRLETNGSAPGSLVAPAETLTGVGPAEAERVLRVLGYGREGATRVLEGTGVDMREEWPASCELALRLWSLPERDDNTGCADGATDTFTANTSLGARTVSFYCGGETQEVREFHDDWCRHVSTGAAKVGKALGCG